MTNSDAPQDSAAAPDAPHESAPGDKRQTLDDVITDGEEPTPELLQELEALEQAPPLSEEELARQALEHPGADGDPSTPE